jgi:transposase
VRRAVKHSPDPEVYALKREALAECERLSEQGQVAVFYGDESRVSMQPCIPYAWQFADEQVVMPSEQGGGVNCFALISRDNRCHVRLTQETITAAFVSEELDAFSWAVERPTVVVLDNARVHTKAVKAREAVWQERGLFVLFLPTYSPHLNIAEVLWRKLKYEWLRPEDYADEETLRLSVWQALMAVGASLNIAFSPFKMI